MYIYVYMYVYSFIYIDVYIHIYVSPQTRNYPSYILVLSLWDASRVNPNPELKLAEVSEQSEFTHSGSLVAAGYLWAEIHIPLPIVLSVWDASRQVRWLSHAAAAATRTLLLKRPAHAPSHPKCGDEGTATPRLNKHTGVYIYISMYNYM